MSNHSPEPWKLVPTGQSEAVLSDSQGGFIAGYSSDEGAIDVDDPNFRRIVACVNFLAGFPTEYLESINQRETGINLPNSIISYRWKLRQLLVLTEEQLP